MSASTANPRQKGTHERGVAAGLLVPLLLLLVVSACETVDLGPSLSDVNSCRPSQKFFYEKIWPQVLVKDLGGRKCSDPRCHDISSGRQLTLPMPTSTPTVPLPPDWEVVYKAAAEQMRCTNVSTSPLLMRPAGLVTHGGGMLFTPQSTEAGLIRMWVEAQ